MNWFEHSSIDYSVVSKVRAVEIKEQLRQLDELDDPALRWTVVSKSVLKPSDTFELHRDLFRENYGKWDLRRGPPPAILPGVEAISKSNLGMWLEELALDRYSEFHDFSVSHREEFMKLTVEKLKIRFQTTFDQVLNLTHGVEHPSWFMRARLNIVDSIFDAEYEPDAERAAIVFQRERRPGEEGTAPVQRWSLGQLKAWSGRVANGLTGMGLRQGDAVAIDMPMTANCVAIYLGIVRAGMSVVSIADSFPAAEIATRLRLSGTRAIFTQDFIVRGGKTLPLYQKVVDAKAPVTIVVSAGTSSEVRLRERDMSFDHFLSDDEDFKTVDRDPSDTMNIMFSSGTTGDPKVIPWDHTIPVRCALDGFVHQDIRAGDVVAWPTSIGWMMGPWLIFATLINRGCIALYDGMPHTREFGKFVEAAGVRVLGVVPSLVKAWKSSGCMAGLDWSGIRSFGSTGEASNGEEMLFLMSLGGYKPVIEYCGGTEIGGAYVSSTVTEPNCPSYFSAKVVGMDFRILDEAGRDSQIGEVYLVPPAVGLSTRLLNKDHHEVYFEGCPTGGDGELLRRHGDEMQMLPGPYFRALGRADDTMNLGGIKVSSVELENAMNRANGVIETAAVAVPPKGGGASQLLAYAVTEPGAWDNANELKAELQKQIRQHLNPLFKITDVVIINALPRTASNKVMRRVLRAEYKTQ